MIEVHANPDFAEPYRTDFVKPRREPAHAAFERAIARGEIPADTDIEVVLDLLTARPSTGFCIGTPR